MDKIILNINNKKTEINTLAIISVDTLVRIDNLQIPAYQRPYKWTVKNVNQLFIDIKTAMEEETKYRLGTIILHNNKKDKTLDIVDGQQRILTLSLIIKAIQNNHSELLSEIEKNIYCKNIFTHSFNDEISRKNIYSNYKQIEMLLSKDSSLLHRILTSFKEIFEVVIICVSDISEAFQLFDSQNSRGKALYPQDLLKAYHLRSLTKDTSWSAQVATTQKKEVKNPILMLIQKWEYQDDKKVNDLFNQYLFPILNWSKGHNTHKFTANDLDFYKGYPIDKNYNSTKRIQNANPFYIINEPFIEGKDFFNAIKRYLRMLKMIENKINYGKGIFCKIRNLLREVSGNENCDNDTSLDSLSKGFRYCFNLFKCALLFYYNKFKNFDTENVKLLFIWALNLRLKKSRVSRQSVNHYVNEGIKIKYDDENDDYKYIFSEIANSFTHSAISLLPIVVEKSDNFDKKRYKNVQNEREKLLVLLKNL